MKNKIIFFLLGASIVLAIFWVKRELYLIVSSDPDFNTIYSSKYSEGLFNEDLIGKNEKELDRVLGEPLFKYRVSFFNALLYTNNKDSIFLNKDFNCIQIKNDKRDRQFRCFYLDSIGKVKKAKIVGYNEKENSYDGLSKEDIVKKFGLPDDEVSNPSYEVLSFSDLTKGAQSGKRRTINIRKILLNRNKVATQIIREVGGETRVCRSCDCK